MTDARTEEIRARHEAAAPGPWGTSRDLDGTYTIQHGTRVTREDGFGSDGDVAVLLGDEKAAYANGAFIARARDDVPYLLDRVAELEATLHEVLDTFGPMHEVYGGPVSYYDGSADIEPKQYERWQSALGATKPTAAAHACDNCDGVDPETCLNTPKEA